LCRGIEVGVGIFRKVIVMVVTHRRILANVLRYACCVADLVGELVAEDACRLGVFAVVTRAAGKLELACVLVFSRVE